jgi:phosphatidylethanolamine/phosphatidyl-N-methylethanolamine N-methyltransferase
MMNEDQEWLDYRNRFSAVYDESNYASPLQAFAMRASHRLLEREFGSSVHFGRVVEIGAGTGEHLPFVQHSFDEYTLTDLDAKTLEVAASKLKVSPTSSVRYEVQAGRSLGFPSNCFDRLIATHVLEHISEPHLAIKEWRRVLKHSGTLSVLIPTDPGIAWRLGRHLGPRRNAMRQGIAYDYVMAREHVNSINNLIALLRHYFPGSSECWWPLRIPSIDVNLFFAFHAKVNKQGLDG